MNRFWPHVLSRIARAIGATRICEVGAQRGYLTEQILEHCREIGGVVHVIDPKPEFDVDAWREHYGETFVFHRALSLDALPDVGTVDFLIIDGDHNWHTVLGELQLMDRLAEERGTRRPVIALHDTGWPYGRRDLYYDPATIPEGRRQPYAQRGLQPDTRELVDHGFNAHLRHAIHEGTPRNGVLTAVEDFLAESERSWALCTLPGLHGLGVLAERERVDSTPSLARELKRLRSAAGLREQLEVVERERILAEISVGEARRKLNAAERAAVRAAEEADVRVSEATAGAQKDLLAALESRDALQDEMTALQAALVEARERLSAREREASEGSVELARVGERLEAAEAMAHERADVVARTTDRIAELNAALTDERKRHADLERVAAERAVELARLAERLATEDAAARNRSIEVERVNELGAALTEERERRAAAERVAAERAVDLARLEQRLEAAADAAHERASVAERVAELANELTAVRESARRTAADEAATAATVARLEAQRGALAEQLEALRTARQEAVEETLQWRESAARLERELRQAAAILGRAEGERQELATQLAILRGERDAARDELTRLRSEHAVLYSERESAARRLETLESAYSEVEEALGRARSDRDELERALADALARERHLRRRDARARDRLEAALDASERERTSIEGRFQRSAASVRSARRTAEERDRAAAAATVNLRSSEDEAARLRATALREEAGRSALEAHVEVLRNEIAQMGAEDGALRERAPEENARAVFAARYQELRGTARVEHLDERDIALPWPVFTISDRAPHHPRISIIICVRDALADVRRCLQSVAHHLTADAEVIVVDDGSDAVTAGFLDRIAGGDGRLQLIRNSEPPHGYTLAANLGLQAARGDYLVLLNSDTIVTAGWLERIIACGESDPAIGLIGPVSNAASHQSVPRIREDGAWATNPLPPWLTVEGMGAAVAGLAAAEHPRIPFVNGFCYVIRRRVLDAIGYLDEERFASGYCEENDFSLRARQAGFEAAVADDAFVFHAKSRSYTSEGRNRLARRNYRLFLEKHGEPRVRSLVDELESNPPVAALGERLDVALEDPAAFVAHLQERLPEPLRPLFVLPGMARGGSGGSHSIAQEVAGMRDLGVEARIAVPASAMTRVEEAYPRFLEAFVTYTDDDELESIAGDATAVVATHFRSVALVQALRQKRPDLLAAYYVQDYEPFFAPSGSESAEEAVTSYGLLSDALLFAKTHWLCTMVRAAHGVRVAKVEPSIDTAVYWPADGPRPEGPVRITAMVRPRTPRRQPATTVATLERLRRCFGADLEVTTFGCESSELARFTDDPEILTRHAGMVTREQVGDLLRRSDAFLDLSIYQAFGRTALEAMACGCVPIVPRVGGVWEFAEDGVNAAVTDSSDEVACFASAARIVRDPDHRDRLRAAGLQTAAGYSVLRAALSEISVLAAASLHPDRRAGRARAARGISG